MKISHLVINLLLGAAGWGVSFLILYWVGGHMDYFYGTSATAYPERILRGLFAVFMFNCVIFMTYVMGSFIRRLR